jgi:hypothetical protein
VHPTAPHVELPRFCSNVYVCVCVCVCGVNVITINGWDCRVTELYIKCPNTNVFLNQLFH